jgi:hypothetical protein
VVSVQEVDNRVRELDVFTIDVPAAAYCSAAVAAGSAAAEDYATAKRVACACAVATPAFELYPSPSRRA